MKQAKPSVLELWGGEVTRLATGLACFTLLFGSPSAGEQEREPPLELTLSYWPGVEPPGKPFFYSVSVMPSRQIVREGDYLSRDQARRLGRPYIPMGPSRVSATTLAHLRRLILRERFFEMQRCYGCPVDLGARIIEADLDGRKHRVGFLDLEHKDVPLGRAQALLRIWYGALAAVTNQESVNLMDDQDARILARKR